MYHVILRPKIVPANASLISIRACLFLLVGVVLGLCATDARANMYHDCGQGEDLDRSIRACTQIIEGGDAETERNRTIAYNNRGNDYFNKSEYDRAIADYSKAIALNPKFAATYMNRGNAYLNKSEYDRAIADYSKSIELNPKLADAYYNRARAYEQMGAKDKALADYRRELEISPTDQDGKDALKRLGETAGSAGGP